MATLTKKEQAVLDILSSKLGKPFTADQIAAELWEGDDRPEHWRHGLLFTLRILAAKTEAGRIKVVRTTKLGRGHEAKYTAERATERATEPGDKLRQKDGSKAKRRGGQKGTSLKFAAVV